MRFYILCCAVLCISLSVAVQSQAEVILMASEMDGIVTITGSGTIDTRGLSYYCAAPNMGSEINPLGSSILTGATWPVTGDVYTGSITSPANFGTGNITQASSGSGGLVGRPGNASCFVVPLNYQSGALINCTSTYNATLAELGMATGTYVWSWGSGSNADRMTLNVVPEPSIVVLGVLGILGIAFCRLRRRYRTN